MSENPASAILFWIAPRNEAAERCLENETNAVHVDTIPGTVGKRALFVTFGNDVRTAGSLLTFGLEGDVVLRGHKISRTQFQVLLHPKSLEIIIRDLSTYKNTKVVHVTNPENLYFSTLESMPRQVVLRRGDIISLSTGGENKDLYKFEVIWPESDAKANNGMEMLKTLYMARGRNPRFSVTPYETPSGASRYESRVRSPKADERWLHRKVEVLGAGAFGEVYETVNLHTGEHFAVKVVKRNTSYMTETDWRKAVRKEVDVLQTLCHRNVVEYYHSQGFKIGSHPIEIFMGLYEGSVESLVIKKPEYRSNEALLAAVFQQMLKALVYIASKGIIHRDVKPANILYVRETPNLPGTESVFKFVLADFGLSKEQIQARSLGKGSPLFMAPEMRIPRAQQSHKVDVYSLGVTMLAILDAGEIVSNPVTSEQEIPTRLQAALQHHKASTVTSLLLKDPTDRPSARQIFLQHWPNDEEALQMVPQEPPPPPPPPPAAAVRNRSLTPLLSVHGSRVRVDKPPPRRNRNRTSTRIENNHGRETGVVFQFIEWDRPRFS